MVFLAACFLEEEIEPAGIGIVRNALVPSLPVPIEEPTTEPAIAISRQGRNGFFDLFDIQGHRVHLFESFQQDRSSGNGDRFIFLGGK